MSKHDAVFEKIAEETIRSTEVVKCPFEDFVEGLEIVWQTIRDRHIEAKQELNARLKGD